MIKKLFGMILIAVTISFMSSCALIKRPLDDRTGFSEQLKQLEDNIRNERWEDAKKDIEASRKTWKKLKIIMQIDIDHDYVNNIEMNFVKLDGYIDTKDKSNSLVSVLLVKDTWKT